MFANIMRSFAAVDVSPPGDDQRFALRTPGPVIPSLGRHATAAPGRTGRGGGHGLVVGGWEGDVGRFGEENRLEEL